VHISFDIHLAVVVLILTWNKNTPEGTVFMSTVHNPDQYMYDFKHILTHGRKKIGILIGAGAPVSINIGNSKDEWQSLIPDIAGLTEIVKAELDKEELLVYLAIEKEISNCNLELVLSRVRSLAEVIGTFKVNEFDASEYSCLALKICKIIKNVVSQALPKGETPYSNLISWINGINREHAVEVFTTNYDLLLEEAMENAKTPYFDGFSGSRVAFFDPSSISSNDLPPRWIRLWKLHGSINWTTNSSGAITRSSGDEDGTMVYPSHVKYDQTQSAPFSSLFERLKSFLLEPDTILLTTGFSFADAHISAKLDECLSENPSAAILAFQFNNLENETQAKGLALRRPNLSVYCRDGAVINGIEAEWKIGEEPTKNWNIIRNEYWDNGKYTLGDFEAFAKFLANSNGDKMYDSLITHDLGEANEE
jgi:hypothetical protein